MMVKTKTTIKENFGERYVGPGSNEDRRQTGGNSNWDSQQSRVMIGPQMQLLVRWSYLLILHPKYDGVAINKKCCFVDNRRPSILPTNQQKMLFYIGSACRIQIHI